jgi:hypothetical protein
VKLDNVEVTPEEVAEALSGPVSNGSAPQHHPKEEVYEEDYETAYRQQAATSNFRGHSPVREVNFSFLFGIKKSFSSLHRFVQVFI